MRTRHPARLAGRIVCWLIEPHPVDFEALDAHLDAVAAHESKLFRRLLGDNHL